MPIQMYESIKTETIFSIPNDYVIVLKSDLEHLEDQLGVGEWKDLKWFKEKVGISKKEVLDALIFKPYREELDIGYGGFIHYPDVKGDPWKFLRRPTEVWLEENFAKIYRRRTDSRI